MKALCLALSGAVFVSGYARAEQLGRAQEMPPPPAEYLVECQMITIPSKLVPSIVPELNDETRTVATVQRLQEMIARGEARLTAHLLARGQLGVRTTAESFEEVKYPTEFNPPAVPATTPLAPALEMLNHWPHIGVTPSAFDTRYVGQSLVIEAGPTADPRVLDVSCVPQQVRLENMMKIDAGQARNGEPLFVVQPRFSDFKAQFNTNFVTGVPKLVGVHRTFLG